jgi:hypothetical protein
MACAVAGVFSTNCNNVGVDAVQKGGNLEVTLAIAQSVVSSQSGAAPWAGSLLRGGSAPLTSGALSCCLSPPGCTAPQRNPLEVTAVVQDTTTKAAVAAMAPTVAVQAVAGGPPGGSWQVGAAPAHPQGRLPAVS